MEVARAADKIRPPVQLKKFLDVNSYPEWLVNVCKEIFQQATPAAKLQTFKMDSPKSVGLWLGQNIANFYAIGETVQRALDAGRNNSEQIDAFEKRIASNAHLPSVQNLLRVMKIFGHLEKELAKEASRLERMAFRAFKLAIDQESYQESVDFFQGFAKGISKRGLNGTRLARSTDATNIYMTMFYNWEKVDSFQNVAMLRDFLLQIGFTEQQLGGPDRLHKLCYRVKYRPGKRGRPPKPRK